MILSLFFLLLASAALLLTAKGGGAYEKRKALSNETAISRKSIKKIISINILTHLEKKRKGA